MEKLQITSKSKIYIVNTFIISKIQYTTTPLYITDTFCAKAQQKINDFVWDNKKPKISNDILQQNFPEGGLRLPNIKRRILSQKMRFIKFWNEKHLWTQIANEQYQCTGDTLLSTKLETFAEQCLPTNQILQHWYNIQTITHQGKVNLQDVLYKHTLNRITAKNLTSLNITTIQDVLNIENRQTLNNMTFQIHATRTNIVGQMKAKGMVNQNPLHVKRGHMLVDVVRCTSKDLYWLTQPIQTPKSIVKWEQKYTKLKWKHMFKNINQITKHYKTHKMQFYIAHKCLNTRQNLYKWKKTSSPLCLHCGIAEEDEEHLFLDCTKNCNFIENIYKLLKHENCPCSNRRNTMLHENIKCLEVHKKIIKAKYYMYCQRFTQKIDQMYMSFLEITKLQKD